MPTGLAVGTMALFSWIEAKTGSSSPAWFFGWLGVNLSGAVGFGLLDRKLGKPTAASKDSIWHVAGFLLLQLLIVPVASLAIVLVNFHAD